MNQQTISDRIKQRLEDLGLSMKEASRRANLGETAVRDLVTREGHSPKVSTLLALAPVLETSFVWLVTGHGSEHQDPETAEVLDILSDLADADARKNILDFARWQANKK